MRIVLDIIEYFLVKTVCFLLSGGKRNKFLRLYGLKIGKGSEIFTTSFSTEPFLIEIGEHTVISNGTKFITHDGAVWTMEGRYPDIDVFGPIKIGDNTFVGVDVIIMPNTVIGSNCIIGAGSVVRGLIPDNSIVIGNPAKVIMKTKMFETMILHNKHCLNSKHLKRRKKMRMVKEHFKKFNENM